MTNLNKDQLVALTVKFSKGILNAVFGKEKKVQFVSIEGYALLTSLLSLLSFYTAFVYLRFSRNITGECLSYDGFVKWIDNVSNSFKKMATDDYMKILKGKI